MFASKFYVLFNSLRRPFGVQVYPSPQVLLDEAKADAKARTNDDV
jgi:hypothetical protein